MANFQTAIDYLLINEGGRFEDQSTGEITNFGISLRWLQTVEPDATADTVRNLSREAAEALYEKYWWDQYHVGSIPSDPVATKLFDHMVNMGAGTAVRIFQDTLNEPTDNIDQHVAVDGLIGPQVIAAVKEEMGQATGVGPLLDAFAVNLVSHYQDIAAKNPALAKNLKNWEARAEKLPQV